MQNQTACNIQLPQRAASAPPNIRLESPSSPQGYAAPVRFDNEHFTIIPNTVINQVLDGTLKATDLLTYSYLLTSARDLEYSLQPIESICFALAGKPTAIKKSLKRLREASIIKRKKTLGYSRTYFLVRHINEAKTINISRKSALPVAANPPFREPRSRLPIKVR